MWDQRIILTAIFLVNLISLTLTRSLDYTQGAWVYDGVNTNDESSKSSADKIVSELEHLKEHVTVETPKVDGTSSTTTNKHDDNLPALEKQLEDLHAHENPVAEIPVPFAIPFPYVPPARHEDVPDIENPVTHAKSTTAATSRMHHLPANLLPFDSAVYVESSTQHAVEMTTKRDEEKPTPKTYSGAARLTGCATCAADHPSNEKVENEHGGSVTQNGQKRINLEAKIMSLQQRPAELLVTQSGKQYSAKDLAQYIFWTGDETGVARAIEELIDQGVMPRETALILLKQIRNEIENLQETFVKDDLLKSLQSVDNSDFTSQVMDKAQERFPSFVAHKTFATLPRLIKLNEIEGSTKKDTDYDDTAGRLRLADFLYAEYSLEEVIYQLAKVMFSQSLNQGSEEAQVALQRLTNFLENEGTYGRISPSLQKKILDVLLAALSDTLNENPELMVAAKKALGGYLNRLPKHSQYKN